MFLKFSVSCTATLEKNLAEDIPCSLWRSVIQRKMYAHKVLYPSLPFRPVEWKGQAVIQYKFAAHITTRTAKLSMRRLWVQSLPPWEWLLLIRTGDLHTQHSNDVEAAVTLGGIVGRREIAEARWGGVRSAELGLWWYPNKVRLLRFSEPGAFYSLCDRRIFCSEKLTSHALIWK